MGCSLGNFEGGSVLGDVEGFPVLALRAARGACGALDTACDSLPRGDGLAEAEAEGWCAMNLRIYAVVLELVRRLGPMIPRLRARSAALGDQFERALISIPLNCAEGAYSRGRNQQVRFCSAAGSAREALACLETAQALGWLAPLEPEVVALFNQVIGTLMRLVRPRR